ncbi:hypothetical protein GCM10009619_16420 [Williamsia maris]
MTERDSVHTLLEHLMDARRAAGSPSLRTIAARTDYSHTTVAKAFTDAVSTMSWPVVAAVGVAVDADAALTRRLWSQNGASGPVPVDTIPRTQAPTATLVAWCGLLLTGGVAIAVMQAVDRNVAHTTFVTDLVQAVFAAIATAAFVRRAHQARTAGERRTTAFFAALAAGTLAWTAGQVAWFVARNLDHQPIPSGHLHDVGFLLMPVGVGVAMWMRGGDYGLTLAYRPWQRALSLVCMAAATYAAMILLLTLADLPVDGFILIAALYPTGDVTLALMALSPLICGYRVVGSVVLATALLGAAASDIGYLMMKADTETQMMPAAAALGYIAFTIVLTIYAFIAQRLPARPRPTLRWESLTITTVHDAGTAGCALLAVGFALCLLVTHHDTAVGVVGVGIIALTTAALAARVATGRHTDRADGRT